MNKFGKVIGKILILLGAFLLMCIGAALDFPYFIRKIPGETFLGIWAVFALVLLLINYIAVAVATKKYLKGNVENFMQMAI